jgi:hypothetical protein
MIAIVPIGGNPNGGFVIDAIAQKEIARRDNFVYFLLAEDVLRGDRLGSLPLASREKERKKYAK